MKAIHIFIFICSISISCQQKPTSEDQNNSDRPNIILINAEDISPAFGCYGDTNAITPNIDSLAKKSVVFNRAYANSPICSPSRSTLVTGLYATSLGTQHLRSDTPFPEELQTLPEFFTQAGYFTSIYGKTDYNFDPEGLWEYWHDDEAPWRQRTDDRPFLSVFTLKQTHEGTGNSLERYRTNMEQYPSDIQQRKNKVPVPPYFPDTEEFRDLWTRYYDLITLFDQQVGVILDKLKEDGEHENTIIFIHSDHGFGMPRYKRWLYETGIRVPLVIHLPEKYQHLSSFAIGSTTQQLVSFVDFVPTALALAGIDIPDYIQGKPFLGNDIDYKKPDIYAYRSRADNVYDMSRAVRDTQFLYVRHFMPHLPYIQKSVIFSDAKDSYRTLHQMMENGTLHEEGMKMFGTKPIEELYDLAADPMELNNLALDEEYAHVMTKMRARLEKYVLQSQDLGFLYESEMATRAAGKPPYNLRNNQEAYNLPAVFQAANKVGKATQNEITAMLADDDTAIQFWGIMCLHQISEPKQLTYIDQLQSLAANSSVTVKIAAAELLYRHTQDKRHLLSIADQLQHPINEVVLQAARALEILAPTDPEVIRKVETSLAKYRSPEGANFPYIDYNFASFISWSLEEVVKNYQKQQRLLSMLR